MNPTLMAAGFGLLCTVASWPVSGFVPTTGGDPSFEFGLAFAAVHHTAWGPHLDFTFGPLGFLDFPTLYFASTATLAFLYGIVVRITLFALLFRFTRITLPLPLAGLVSYAIGVTVIASGVTSDALMGPTFLLALLALRQPQLWIRRSLIGVLSVVSALGLLTKFSDGLVPLAMVAVVIAVGRGKERILDTLVAVISFLPALLGAWLATGNGQRAQRSACIFPIQRPIRERLFGSNAIRLGVPR